MRDGKNGAGKTTLLKTITDVYLPESGAIFYDGISLAEEPVRVKEKPGFTRRIDLKK